VLTNKTPSGLVRGFGGPQVYFALERLMQRIAAALGLDPLEVIQRNLVEAFPYRCPAGAILDSGDHRAAVDVATERGGLARLRHQRDRARSEGRLYGIGFAAVVEPAISNMGYITTVLSPRSGTKPGPKAGPKRPPPSASTRSAAFRWRSTRCRRVRVTAPRQRRSSPTSSASPPRPSGSRGQSIPARMPGRSLRAIIRAGLSVRLPGPRISPRPGSETGWPASPRHSLNARPEDLVFADGRVFVGANPENSLSFARVAATDHWSPVGSPEPALRETVFWSPPVLGAPNAADEVNGAAVYGFVFDFCGLEIERDTGTVRVDKYVSLHDAGRILNPALLDGQVCGGFAMAVGAALYERLVYAEDGGFLTGSLLDYALPTASMIPELEILHQETPSPVTPLGAKGVAEGNSMSTPVCIANAVADALGMPQVNLSLTPERVLEMVRRRGE